MLTDPNQPKKKPIVVKDLPFDLPTFEAQRYTPAAAQPNLTRLGYSLARTVATAKQALATPMPPKRGTPPASKATPRPVQAPTPSPTVPVYRAKVPAAPPVRYALPEYAPNMSTASGPVYVPPPAQPVPPYMPMIQRQLPAGGGASGAGGGGYDPALFKPLPYGPYDEATLNIVGPALYPGAYTPAEQQAAQPPATPAQDKKAGRQRYGNRGGSGYYPSRYYGGSSGRYYGGGGGGGGGAAASDYERYGISQPWMEAYKAFWGQDMPTNMWGLYNQLVELFARYAGRMPQLSDWQSIWQSIKADYTARGVDFPNPYSRLEMYEPLMEKFAPQPTVQLPTVSYGPGLSF